MYPTVSPYSSRSPKSNRTLHRPWAVALGVVAALLVIAPRAAGGAADPAGQTSTDLTPSATTDAARVTAALPAQELARIRAALERMVVLMERQAGDRRAGLALQRLQMETGRMERLEGRLASVQDSRASVEDQRRELEERYRQYVRHQEQAGEGLPEEERLAMREELDIRLDILEARSAELGREAAELANRLAESRRTVREWESVVDRQLQE